MSSSRTNKNPGFNINSDYINDYLQNAFEPNAALSKPPKVKKKDKDESN